MKVRDIVMIVVVAAIFVGAIVGIAVGVATHDEPGFMTDAPVWEPEDVPLRVRASRYTAEGLGPADRGPVDYAMGLYDEELFRWADGEDADVVIVVGVPYDETWRDPGGDARIIHTAGRAERCEVRTSNTGTADLLWMTLAHELGHCLGLAHDDYEASIMRPEQQPLPDLALSPFVSDHDRDLLRERYVAP